MSRIHPLLYDDLFSERQVFMVFNEPLPEPDEWECVFPRRCCCGTVLVGEQERFLNICRACEMDRDERNASHW